MPEKNKIPKVKSFIAARDFRIYMPPKVDIKIKKGDDVEKLVPSLFWQNLLTEKVIS